MARTNKTSSKKPVRAQSKSKKSRVATKSVARRKSLSKKAGFSLSSLSPKQILKLTLLVGIVVGALGTYLQYSLNNHGGSGTAEAATVIRDLSFIGSGGITPESGYRGYVLSGQTGPGGARVIRNTLVDGNTGASAAAANERSDAQGGSVPLGSIRWNAGWQRITELPANMPNGSNWRWYLMGFWEVHGQTLPQATVQPEIWRDNGQYRMRLNTNAGSSTHRYFDLGPVTLNKWEYIEVGLKYSNGSDGWIEIYRDGRLAAKVTGKMTNEARNGYWKIANYRTAGLSGNGTYDISGVKVWDSRPPYPGNTPAPPPSNPTPTPAPTPSPTPTPTPAPTPAPPPSTGATKSVEAEVAGQCFNQKIVSCSTMLKNDSKASLGKAVILFANGNSITHQFQTGSGQYKVGFTMKGENYRGNAKIDAYIDGVRIASGFAIKSTDAYVFHHTNRKFSAGTHTMKVVFINDKCGNRLPSEQCNKTDHDRNALMDQFRVVEVK